MRNRVLLLLPLFFVVSFLGIAQVLPKEGSKLNFRLIGFSFPQESGVKGYSIEVAKGDFRNEIDFKKNICVKRDIPGNVAVIEVPEFGSNYTWRVTKAGSRDAKLYHFSTVGDERVDTNLYRLRTVVQSKDYGDKYFLLDGGGIIYDSKGMPVAYLPEKGDIRANTRCLTVTPDSTLTFVGDSGCFETDLSSNILWRTPSAPSFVKNASTFLYHHDFVRLRNGHYLAMGNEVLMTKQVITTDTAYYLFSESALPEAGYSRGIYGSLIEFDKDKNVIWYWRDLDHLIGTDYDYFPWPEQPAPPPNLAATRNELPQVRGAGLPNSQVPGNAPAMPKRIPMFGGKFDPHSNAFYFDEEAKSIYLSYRNLNRILKISYRDGQIVETYGQSYKNGVETQLPDILCNQHAVRATSNGDIYFFNNNSCKLKDSLPAVIMLKQGGGNRHKAKKVWEHICKDDGVSAKLFATGGNAIEMDNGEFLICMGGGYSKVMILNRAHEELWSAFPEKYNVNDKTWANQVQYRVNITSRRNLEQLIWKSETLCNN